MTSAPDHALLRTAPGQTDATNAPTTETRLLLSIGFRPAALAVAQKIADRRDTTMAEELIRLHYLRPDVWWDLVAQDLGVRHFRDLYLTPRPLDAILPDARFFQRIRQVWHRKSDAAVLVVAPRGHELDKRRLDIALDPSMRQRLAVASPHVIRRAFRRSFEAAMTHQAIGRLRGEQPAMSAASGPSLRRRIVALFIATAILAFCLPRVMLVLMDLLFLLAGVLRLASVVDMASIEGGTPLADAELPTYAILIPLFREAGVIADLVRAIERIDYPREKLSVNLVVEADDRETLAAAMRIAAGSRIRVIAVPPSKPRTKPKALVWALPIVDAELLTVYDAEDRPAPDQLRLAAAAFAAAPPDMDCIQAVLDIDHAAVSTNWLSRQFALEYRVLFRSLLPWLARHRLFLPLGGTSNHFRRDALVRIGAWDPFNVTEDADISIRIQRMGGRIGMLDSVTSEEAPLRWRAWHLQRTRWMKGWLQTWLVHMRHPLRLLRDIGIGNFLTFQVLILGQVLSALVCPIGVTLILLDLAGLIPLFADRDFEGDLLLAFQLLALCCGWLGAAAAVLATAGKGGKMVRRQDLLTVPIYWLLLFGAAVSAITELIVDPHRWNKTGHGLAERTAEPKADRFPPRMPDSFPPPPPPPVVAAGRDPRQAIAPPPLLQPD